MKRAKVLLSILLAALLFTGLVPWSVFAEDTPLFDMDKAVFVDLGIEGADGLKLGYHFLGKDYDVTIGQNLFKTVSKAVEALQPGGTLILGPGEYTEGVTFKYDVTILGPKAGIDPNVKGETKEAAWTGNPLRGTDEAVLKTSWHMGINANSGVFDAHEITVDGLAVSGAGMFRSNYGAAGNITLNYKNMLIYGYTTANNGPFYCYSYYPDRSTNLYVRNVNAENIRFEGQTTAPGFNLTIENFSAKGICFDGASTKGLFEYVTVPNDTASKNPVTISVTDCMFMQNRTNVITLNLMKNAGGHNFNANIASKPSVTAKVTDCVFYVPYANRDGSDVIKTQSETANVTFEIQGNKFVPEEPDTVEPDATHFDLSKEVRFLGRTYEKNGTYFFNWSGSGFTFSFKGSEAKAKIVSSAPGGGNNAFIKIFVDGVEQPDVELTKTSQTITLASGLDATKEHVITVQKRTNARSSSAGVNWISINEGGAKLAPTEKKARLIEFVGDSLTVGYASVAGNAAAWSTATEDVTKTYIPAICEACDADYDVIAVSGRGVAHNYGGDTDKLIGVLYASLDEYNNPGVKWDYSHKPDVIVINMGTNDESALGTNGYTKDQFSDAYKNLLKDIRKSNPDAKILCLYGLTSKGLDPIVSAAVDELVKAGDNSLAYLKLKACSGSETSLGHPTQAGYQKNVNAIVKAIMELTGWDKEPEVTTAEITAAETTVAETKPAEITTAEETTEAPKSKGCGSGVALTALLIPAAVIPATKKRRKEN